MRTPDTSEATPSCRHTRETPEISTDKRRSSAVYVQLKGGKSKEAEEPQRSLSVLPTMSTSLGHMSVSLSVPIYGAPQTHPDKLPPTTLAHVAAG